MLGWSSFDWGATSAAPTVSCVSLAVSSVSLDGAFALAADDLEQLFLAPVHVDIDVLVDGTDFLELVEERVERLRPEAVDEGDELLDRKSVV